MLRQRIILLLMVLAGLIAGLTRCSDAREEAKTLTDTLLLDAERLTFVFFYADP